MQIAPKEERKGWLLTALYSKNIVNKLFENATWQTDNIKRCTQSKKEIK